MRQMSLDVETIVEAMKGTIDDARIEFRTANEIWIIGVAYQNITFLEPFI